MAGSRRVRNRRRGPFVRSCASGRPVREGCSGTGPGAITPDGRGVELYRRLPVGDGPEVTAAAVPAGARVLEPGCGAGRVSRPLTGRGFEATAVDGSARMPERVQGARTVRPGAGRDAARLPRAHLRRRAPDPGLPVAEAVGGTVRGAPGGGPDGRPAPHGRRHPGARGAPPSGRAARAGFSGPC
ncbi:class I SAM-dependent methyltransferase [Streptomyces sp. NPDC057697]|uniref:class I SAM-dependent methyltransferase n=1 Tax=Streptomyces sp. NPDC057697 TaxID=3346219 RepID=UPI0036A2D191